MTTEPRPKASRDELTDQLLDLVLEDPSLFAVIGEVLRTAAPLIAARRALDALPVVDEP
ncbi:hypothetical protein [Dietzia sp. PP-33]|jgi:hypothetical protein|uniref:hypothetical protein n=1 Tax=Dietzia sp. PP-33 TaxID=2957500 RepID=UPI0029AFEDCD|nr:hypothetical protein [Dietzia sp. PP-33]MDX2358570.1 hypothetical protein [Dietzia sp. PP-33]